MPVNRYLQPLNRQLMPWNFQIQYSYLHYKVIMCIDKMTWVVIGKNSKNISRYFNRGIDTVKITALSNHKPEILECIYYMCKLQFNIKPLSIPLRSVSFIASSFFFSDWTFSRFCISLSSRHFLFSAFPNLNKSDMYFVYILLPVNMFITTLYSFSISNVFEFYKIAWK